MKTSGQPASVTNDVVPVETGYRLQAVWPAPPNEVREDVIRFWLAEAALPDRLTAELRAPELVVVARDMKGNVAGVSTASRRFIPQLGFDCFYYRTFVGLAHRTRGLRSTGLVWSILHESYRSLNTRFQQGLDPQILGLFAEMENPSIMKTRREAAWTADGMNFVYLGKTSNGRHLRVWYFDGAKVP